VRRLRARAPSRERRTGGLALAQRPRNGIGDAGPAAAAAHRRRRRQVWQRRARLQRRQLLLLLVLRHAAGQTGRVAAVERRVGGGYLDDAMPRSERAWRTSRKIPARHNLSWTSVCPSPLMLSDVRRLWQNGPSTTCRRRPREPGYCVRRQRCRVRHLAGRRAEAAGPQLLQASGAGGVHHAVPGVVHGVVPAVQRRQAVLRPPRRWRHHRVRAAHLQAKQARQG